MHSARLFLLTLVTFFTGGKFCKLLFTGFRGKVCYFLLLFLLFVSFVNYFLLWRQGKGCTLIFFLFLFTVEGEGVGG